VVAATGVRRTSVIVPTGLEAQAVVAQGIDPVGADQTMDLGVRSGSLADLRAGTVAVSTTQAGTSGWKLGDNARLWLGDGTPVALRVVAIYDRGWGFGDVTLHAETLAGHTATGLDDHILIRTAPGAEVGTALAELARAYPASTVIGADRLTGELAEDLAISAWLNKLLIAVLVGYAVLAAANTLIMAALARRRELSLLRLVGVTRGQVRRMVHAEQAGLLGVALAIGTTIAAVTLSSVVHAISGERIPYVPALGAATIVGGTIALALIATMLPIGRVLRTPPVEGIGIRE
jgi:putative ABC transport system permease protein